MNGCSDELFFQKPYIENNVPINCSGGFGRRALVGGHTAYPPLRPSEVESTGGQNNAYGTNGMTADATQPITLNLNRQIPDDQETQGTMDARGTVRTGG